MHRFKACQVSLLKAARPTGSSVLSQNKSNLLKLTTNTGGKSRYRISSSRSREKKKKNHTKSRSNKKELLKGQSVFLARSLRFTGCVFFLLRGHALLQTLLPKEAEALHFQTQLSAAYRANILQGSLALLTSYFHIRSHKLHSR